MFSIWFINSLNFFNSFFNVLSYYLIVYVSFFWFLSCILFLFFCVNFSKLTQFLKKLLKSLWKSFYFDGEFVIVWIYGQTAPLLFHVTTLYFSFVLQPLTVCLLANIAILDSNQAVFIVTLIVTSF